MLHAVIMAGGAGTRFWPASRRNLPKQLLSLAGQKTMLQSTLERLGGFVAPENVLILTNESLVDAVSKQLPHLPPESIIGEPCKRDTAPCIGLAAGLVRQKDPSAVMLVMPSDHVIETSQQFQETVTCAVDLIERQPSCIVTFGIPPTYPAECFGYIHRGEQLSAGDLSAYRVQQFREKPKAPAARRFLEDGGYYWNSGIFVWRAATIDEALRKFQPQMHQRLQTITKAAPTGQFRQTFRSEFEAIDGISIDFAVMEKYPDVAVIEAPFTWDDVGNWQSLSRLNDSDGDGNTIMGKHVGVKTKGCIVRGADDHLIATIGLEDIIVVHTPDATLVANKHQEESVRELVKRLEKEGWTEYL